MDYVASFELLRMSDYKPGLKVVTSENLAFNVRFYSRLSVAIARERLKLPIPEEWSWRLAQDYWMPVADADRSGADVVLSYERYPINARHPVIWIGGTVDIEGMRRRGVSAAHIQRLIDFKRAANRRAAATVVPTAFKKRLFDDAIRPSVSTRVIPFFQPVQPVSKELFLQKWMSVEPLKLLFVGRAPRRKGLALVLQAYESLCRQYPNRVSLHVVTTHQDGVVDIPALPGLTLDSFIPQSRVIELMSEAHYLLMPSSLEEYGFVYVEAMARGMIPLASDSPVQRDLLDDGRAGLLVERNPEAIVGAIRAGLDDPESARSLAARAFALWHSRYAPAVIAQQYASLAESVSQRPGAGG
jgi:glycosyltransferase involved in cell wall biosynthesis